MAATIYDVAALAGVSPATVSRVLNGTAGLPRTRRKVRDAAQALGFRPNRMARTLRKGGSEVIALVIPDVENSFFTALARGVEDRAMAAGYSVVLCNTDELAEKEARYLEIAVDEQVAGVVLAAASVEPDLSALTARRVPVVAVDRAVDDLAVDVLTLDDQGAAAVPPARLQAGGNPGGLRDGLPRHGDGAAARPGVARGLAERCPGADPDLYLRHTDYRPGGGRRAAGGAARPAPPPDAIFAANNMLGAGVLAHLAQWRDSAAGRGPRRAGRPALAGVGGAGRAVEPWPGRPPRHPRCRGACSDASAGRCGTSPAGAPRGPAAGRRRAVGVGPGRLTCGLLGVVPVAPAAVLLVPRLGAAPRRLERAGGLLRGGVRPHQVLALALVLVGLDLTGLRVEPELRLLHDRTVSCLPGSGQGDGTLSCRVLGRA